MSVESNVVQSEKSVRVGINQILNVLNGRIEENQVRTDIDTLENKGSPRARMYDIEQVKDKLTLSVVEYSALLALATKPRTKRTPKSSAIDSSELKLLNMELAKMYNRLDEVDTQIESLTKEKEGLKLSISEILPKLKEAFK